MHTTCVHYAAICFVPVAEPLGCCACAVQQLGSEKTPSHMRWNPDFGSLEGFMAATLSPRPWCPSNAGGVLLPCWVLPGAIGCVSGAAGVSLRSGGGGGGCGSVFPQTTTGVFPHWTTRLRNLRPASIGFCIHVTYVHAFVVGNGLRWTLRRPSVQACRLQCYSSSTTTDKQTCPAFGQLHPPLPPLYTGLGQSLVAALGQGCKIAVPQTLNGSAIDSAWTATLTGGHCLRKPCAINPNPNPPAGSQCTP